MTKAVDFNELLSGASIQQLSLLFDKDRVTVRKVIEEFNIQPASKRSGHPIYKVSEIAPFLSRVGGSGRGGVGNKSSHEKDHWDAELKRQKFMENNGDLWRTDVVVQSYIAVFKFIRESVTVFVDRIEYETEVDEKTVTSIKNFADLLLSDTREKILGADFEEKPDESDVDEDLGI